MLEFPLEDQLYPNLLFVEKWISIWIFDGRISEFWTSFVGKADVEKMFHIGAIDPLLR